MRPTTRHLLVAGALLALSQLTRAERPDKVNEVQAPLGDLVAIGGSSLLERPPPARLVDQIAAPANQSRSKLDYIVDFLRLNRLTGFCDLLTKAQLAPVRRQLNALAHFTLFVPTNEALLLMAAGQLEALARQPAELEQFLLAHAARELLVPRANTSGAARALSGAPLRLATLPGRAGQLELIVNGANVLGGHSYALQEPQNGSATYALVHLIDRPLYPAPSEPLAVKLRQLAPKLAQYVELASDARLSEALDSPARLATLFAPTDEALRAAPARLLDQLDTNRTFLVQFLRAHLIEGRLLFTGQLGALGHAQSAGTGPPLRFEHKQVQARRLTLVNSVPIVEADVVATNGVLHLISRPILERHLLDECRCGRQDGEPADNELERDESQPAAGARVRAQRSGELVARNNRDFYRPSTAPVNLLAPGRLSANPATSLPVQVGVPGQVGVTKQVGVAEEPEDRQEPVSEANATVLSRPVGAPAIFVARRPTAERDEWAAPPISFEPDRYKVVLNATSRQRLRDQLRNSASAQAPASWAPPPPGQFAYDKPLAAGTPTEKRLAYTPTNSSSTTSQPAGWSGALNAAEQLAGAAAGRQQRLLKFQPEDARPATPPPAADRLATPPAAYELASVGTSKTLAPPALAGCAFYDAECRRLLSGRLVRLPPARRLQAASSSSNLTATPPHLDSTFGETAGELASERPRVSPLSQPLPPWSEDERRQAGWSGGRGPDADIGRIGRPAATAPKSPTASSNLHFHTPTPFSVSPLTTHLPGMFGSLAAERVRVQQPQWPRPPGTQARKILEESRQRPADISVTSARLRQPSGLLPQASSAGQPVVVRSAAEQTGAAAADFFQNRTIAEIMDDSGLRIDGQQVTFGRLKECLAEADLLELTRQPANSLTIFMPTDAAFQRLVQQQQVAQRPPAADERLSGRLLDRRASLPLVARRPPSGQQGDSDRLTLDCASPPVRQLLLDHLSAFLVSSKQLQRDLVVSSLSGRKLLLSSVPTKKIVVVDGQPVVAATRAKNGVVYVLNKFLNLTHQVPNVADLMAQQANLSTFLSYLTYSGLADRLKRETGPLTVLAPTNEAFEQLAGHTRQLINSDSAALLDLLRGHIVEGAQYGKLVAMRSKLKTMNSDQTIEARVLRPNVYLLDDQTSPMRLLGTSGNGVLNAIDRVLVPAWLRRNASAEPAERQAAASANLNLPPLDGRPTQFERPATLAPASSSTSFSFNSSANEPSSPAARPLQTAGAGATRNMQLIEKLARLVNANKFAKLLLRSTLSGSLKPDMNYVLLVPTDAALDKLPRQVLELLERDPDRLADLVSYHVLDTTFEFINTIPDGQTLSTLNEKDITFNWHRNNTILTASGAVVMGGIQEDNLALLVVDRVLYPTPGDILTIVSNSPILSNLTALLRNAGLERQLALPGPYTLFAPSDAAFGQLERRELDFLRRNKESARRFLLRHLSQPALFTSAIALSQQQQPATGGNRWPRLSVTNSLGEELALSQKNDYFSVNDVNFSYADVAATNGVVHVIDGLL